MAACAIGLDDVRHVDAADAHQGVVHDGQRIFGARIVAGQHHEVAGLGGRLSHQRTLGAVAIAAAAEKRDDALGVEAARHRDDVAQRVVGVRVVHHDDERLAFIHALEAPGHGLADRRCRARSLRAAMPYERPAPQAARMLYTLILPISGDSTGKRSLPYCTSKRSPLKPEGMWRARRSASWPRPYQSTSVLGCTLMRRAYSSSRLSTA